MARRMRITEAGAYVEAMVYTAPEPNDSPKARAQKMKATSLAQKEANDKAAKRRLAMILAANFTGRDLFSTLTYVDTHLPNRIEDVVADVNKMVRKLRRVRKKQGKPLKYLYAIEHKHGEGRFHVHIFINAVGGDLETLISLWGMGSVDIQPLGKYDWGEISAYATKESDGRRVGARMWSGSKNLAKPKVTSAFVPNNTRIEVPINAYILERKSYETEYGFYEYVRYWDGPLNQRFTVNSEWGDSPYSGL